MKRQRSLAQLFPWLLACALAPSLAAGTAQGPFRLEEGHGGVAELAFAARAPGTIQVRVECDTPGVDLYSLLIHEAGAVFSRQGTGAIDFAFHVAPERVAQAHEWCVRIQPVTPGQRASGRISVRYPEGGVRSAHELDAWLARHPAIAMHLRWTDATGAHTYSAWPASMKERLWRFFDLSRGAGVELPDPPPNSWPGGRNAEGRPLTVLAPEDALNLYLATVAHSCRIEMDRAVPWSLSDLNEDELEALFAGASLFHWKADRRGYEIVGASHGWAVPANPRVAWTFLREHGLLRDSRLATLTALLGWCQGLIHFAGPVATDNFACYWGYLGDMPVRRALEGTRYRGEEFRNTPGFADVRHYTAGCYGTVGLLVNLLRSANIPAKCRATGDAVSHATILFLSEDKALTHGDDPYDQLAARASPEELLIDLATYNAWLGPLAPNPGANIERQPRVLALRHLAPFLFQAYANDQAHHTPKDRSEVLAAFNGAYTLADLEAARLWERMDAELAAGTSSSPQPGAPTASRVQVFEAEQLTPSVTGGQLQAQPMDGFSASHWSGNQQLWWTGGRINDVLTLALRTESAGVYRLSATFTRAPDYGTLSVAVDGADAGPDRLDLFAAEVNKTDFTPLGMHKLGPGNHQLTLRLRGSNAAAIPALMAGVDAVRIERLE